MTIGFIQRKQCPVCAAAAHTVLCHLAYSDNRLKGFLDEFYKGRAKTEKLAGFNYKIVKCQRCDFIYQVAVLNDEGMAALYGEWLDSASSLQKKQLAKAQLFKQYARQIEMIGRLFKQKPHTIHVLEFGMGWGYWSRMAKAYGYQVSGLELSPARVAHAQSMGLTVIEEVPKQQKYHFIYASQVFEHLKEPLEVLKTLQKQLHKKGVIYVRVPDGQGIEQALIKNGWSEGLDAIHPLEHINCFTRNTLIGLGKKAGLRAINPPLRLGINSLWGGIKREIADRFFTPHILFEKI